MLGWFIARASAADPATDVLRSRLEDEGYACIELTRTESGYFVVAATLEGKDLSLIVDSGAPCAHLDVARLRAAGIPWPTSVGRTRDEVGNVLAYFKSLGIGRVSAGGVLAVADDLSHNNERMAVDGETPVDGFLGADVLRAHAAVVDLGGNRLFLRPNRITADAPVDRALHEAVATELVARGHASADLDLHARMYLATDASIHDRDLRWMVDTGAPATFLDRRRTEGLGLEWSELERRPTPESPPRPYAFADIELLRLQSMKVGPLRVWSTDSLSKVNESIADFGGDPFDGLLGTDVLIAGHAVIDYPTQRLLLLRSRK